MTFGKTLTLILGVSAAATATLGVSSQLAPNHLKDRFDEAAGLATRRIILADTMHTAESNLMASQRGMLMFQFAGENGRSLKAASDFQASAGAFRSALADLPSLAKVLVDQVTTKSSEQAQEIPQVDRSVAQMSNVTQSTAASAEQSASAAAELHKQSRSLNRLVSELTTLVGTA